MKKVFIVPFHVKRLENSIIPPELAGAYVTCYSQGETYVEAVENILKKLAEDGLHPEEILQPVHEMDASSWSSHVKEAWPDYVDNLPEQSEFLEAISSNQVVYGPFGSYESR
jgi:predicted RNase H-like HicB family nuclease